MSEFVSNAPLAQGLGLAELDHELRITLLSDLDSRENIIAALRRGVRCYLLTSLSLKIASGECDGPVPK